MRPIRTRQKYQQINAPSCQHYSNLRTLGICQRSSATISHIRLYFSGPHFIRRTKTRLAANNLLLPYNNRPQVQCPEQCVHITNTTLLYNGSIIPVRVPVRAQINSSKVQVTGKNMVCATIKLLPLRHQKKKMWPMDLPFPLTKLLVTS